MNIKITVIHKIFSYLDFDYLLNLKDFIYTKYVFVYVISVDLMWSIELKPHHISNSDLVSVASRFL